MPQKSKKETSLSDKILIGIAITMGVLAIIVMLLLALHYFNIF